MKAVDPVPVCAISIDARLIYAGVMLRGLAWRRAPVAIADVPAKVGSGAWTKRRQAANPVLMGDVEAKVQWSRLLNC